MFPFHSVLAFLFDENEYQMGSEKVAIVSKPGVTFTLKIIVTYGPTDLNVSLRIGWGLLQQKQEIFDQN